MKMMKLLVAVAVLQGLTLATLWERGGSQNRAMGQVPDSHGEQVEMINELRDLNKKMERLLAVMESGKLEVRVSPADEKRGR